MIMHNMIFTTSFLLYKFAQESIDPVIFHKKGFSVIFEKYNTGFIEAV